MDAEGLAVHPERLSTDAGAVDREEKFIPPELGDAKMVACYTGGNPDGTNDVYAVVEYVHRNEFRAKIAVRTDVDTALQDCQLWLGEVRRAFKGKR